MGAATLAKAPADADILLVMNIERQQARQDGASAAEGADRVAPELPAGRSRASPDAELQR